MNPTFTLFCGIDVSKDWIDIAVDGKVSRVNQTQEEIEAFIKEHVQSPGETLAVLESTGGYELLAAHCLNEAGATVHIAHPNKVRAFAKVKGQLAKTDKLDALTLSAYGQFIEPDEIRPLRSKRVLKLSALNSRLTQLKHFHHQETCRLGNSQVTSVKQSHQSMLRVIEEQLAQIEGEMRMLITSDPELDETYSRLQTMPGVGPTLALTLVATLPELGAASKKEIAALAGVAPITKDSGKQRGRAMTQNGRAGLRRILYMGALSAIRHDKKMGAFYNRLISSGKAKKVGIVAVMRKMLVILNAMLVQKQDYCPALG